MPGRSAARARAQRWEGEGLRAGESLLHLRERRHAAAPPTTAPSTYRWGGGGVTADRVAARRTSTVN